jgi:hypothetical protein
MAHYIQFTASGNDTASDDNTILVEVEEEAASSSEGIVKAGVAETAHKAVVQAQTTFEEALERVVQVNAEALIQSMRSLPESPDEVELSFGCKVTGEVGNIAIAKGGGEANYTIKLSWKSGAKGEQ